MVIAIVAIIGFFLTIDIAIAAVVLIWYRTCKFSESEQSVNLLKAEAELVREINNDL